ncbi:MAG TPA: VanZ family protein [Burkholderiales bacterium]
MTGGQPSPLSRYLFVAYVLFAVYASLYPFSGWTDRGVPPFAFLTARITRPIPVFDVVVNVVGYLPLGFLAVLVVHPRLRGASAFLFGFACSILLSFALESLQLYLPTRFSSNLDLLANAAGGATGALAAVVGTRTLQFEEVLRHLRERRMLPGRMVDLGLVLIGLWLLSQVNPETLLFGTGDLRELFRAPSGKLYPAEVFLRVEAGVACGNVFAAGLLAFCLSASGQPRRVLAVALVAAALAARSLAFGLLIGPQAVLDWVTPGAIYGTASGIALLLASAGLPRAVQMALAGLALLAATAIVNLSPANPYLTATLSLWQPGHFLNLHSVTRVLSAVWPFAAMFYLVLLATAHQRTGN